MGGKKKSIEARVLETFGTFASGEWYLAQHANCEIPGSRLTNNQVEAACGRLARRGELERRRDMYGNPTYRLPTPTPDDDDTLETAVMAYFNRYPGTCGHASTFAPEIAVDTPGHSWGFEAVVGACKRLVDQNRLLHEEGVGYFLPGTTPAALTRHFTRPSFQRALTAPLDGRIKALVEACRAALYPDEPNVEVTEENLADQITLLRENRDQLKQLAKEELEKRHAAEQALVDAKAVHQMQVADLAEERAYTEKDHAEAEEVLSALQAKLAALDACYRGLFGGGARA